MGYSRYDQDTFRSYSNTHRLADTNTRREEIFTQRGLHEMLDPKGIRVRESRDSDANPASTAIGLFVDHTGSMGILAEQMIRSGLNTLMGQLYERKPVTDPHIMFGAVGDLYTDRVPLEVSQFEADIRIVEQLRLVFLEGNGGGNNGESYSFPWLFMARHTAIDCFEKRQKKGYLFTMGDEPCHPELPLESVAHSLGYRPEGPLLSDRLLAEVSEKYEVFHLMVEQGDYMRGSTRNHDRTVGSWRALLGPRALLLPDSTKMPEVIAAAIQVTEGATQQQAVSGWDDETRIVVERSIGQLGRRLEV